MRTCNCIKIKGILITLFHHGPSKVVTMINRSDDLEFVKTWVNNKEGLRREEGRGDGGGRKVLQNFIPQLLTYQVMMTGVVATAAAQDATQPSHLMVSVSGGPRVDPGFDDMHSRPGRNLNINCTETPTSWNKLPGGISKHLSIIAAMRLQRRSLSELVCD